MIFNASLGKGNGAGKDEQEKQKQEAGHFANNSKLRVYEITFFSDPALEHSQFSMQTTAMCLEIIQINAATTSGSRSGQLDVSFDGRFVTYISISNHIGGDSSAPQSFKHFNSLEKIFRIA